MVTDVLKNICDNNMLTKNEHVMCAFSGGIDSSVMLNILVKLREKLDITVSAAHLNHMLRGEDSMRDEEFVKSVCKSYGIPLVCERIDVNALAEESGESVELAARNARYDFLRRAAEKLGAKKIATAHNANDNLETILLNLARGSGIDGICGIPPMRENIIRPLILIPRCDIEEYATENAISYCEDKTNFETEYSRNKLRHMAIPALKLINESVVENALRSSVIMREESHFLDLMAEQTMTEHAISGENACISSDFASLHPAMQARVAEKFARAALDDNLYTLEFRHVKDIVSLSENKAPSKEIHLPKGLIVRREYEKLVFAKKQEKEEPQKIVLQEGSFSWGGYDVSVKKEEKCSNVHNSVNTFRIPCGKITGNLFLRTRETGDFIKLPKRHGKTVKKLFIDERIPSGERNTIPIIADASGVVAVYGFGVSEVHTASVGDDVIYIEIKAGV